MDWVREREEWLFSWKEASPHKELSFLVPGTENPEPDESNVFFSEAIETTGAVLICRVAGPVVDVFDISPSATSPLLVRVFLPDHVVFTSSWVAPHAAGIFLMTQSAKLHCLDVSIPGAFAGQVLPQIRVGTSAPCSRSQEAPLAMCALGPHLAAISYVQGPLVVVGLQPGNAENTSYELSAGSFLQRMTLGLSKACGSPALALAPIATAGGVRLLSYGADGNLSLWEVSAKSGKLLTSCAAQTHGEGSVFISHGTNAKAKLVVSEDQASACLLLSSSAIHIQLPPYSAFSIGTLAVRTVWAPREGLELKSATLSRGSLFGLWGGSDGKQALYCLSLEDPDLSEWESMAANAALIPDGGDIADDLVPLRDIATKGCGGSGGTFAAATTIDAKRSAHRTIYSLQQQREAYNMEEETFDVTMLSSLDVVAFDTPGGQCSEGPTENQVVSWWVDRVFLPGRFSLDLVKAVLQEAGAWSNEKIEPNTKSPIDVRRALEAFLLRQSAAGGSSGLSASHAGFGFLQQCERAAKACRPLALVGSSYWGSHAFLSARGGACPLVLYSEGVSCVRALHHWLERWRSTCQLFRELSKYERVDIKDLLQLSPCVQWRIFVTGWFLGQCIGTLNLGLALTLMPQDDEPESAATSVAQQLVPKLRERLAEHAKQCATNWLGLADEHKEVDLYANLMRFALNTRFWQPRLGRGTFDALTGVQNSSEPVPQIRLCDLLRGSSSCSEGTSACASLVEAALVVGYARQKALAPPEVFYGLGEFVDRWLPLYMCLREAAGALTPVPSSVVAASAASVWAGRFRIPSNSPILEGSTLPAKDAIEVPLQLPICSWQSPIFASLLLQLELWQPLRLWCKHRELGPFNAYAAARKSLAEGAWEEAQEAFEEGEGAAESLAEVLSAENAEVSRRPPLVAYREHVATLQPIAAAELAWREKAVEAAEDDPHLQDRLREIALDRALTLGLLEDACRLVPKVPDSASSLRRLAAELRSQGRMDLLLRLPEQARRRVEEGLLESAKVSLPIAGSNSLVCYNYLYALHFRAQEHLKAASVAYALYSTLADAADNRDFGLGPAHVDLIASQPWTGDSISKFSEIPGCLASSDGVSAAKKQRRGAVSPHAIWPILDQQRNALLSLLTALSLTPGQMMLVPKGSSKSSMAVDSPSSELHHTVAGGEEDLEVAACNFSRSIGGSEGQLKPLHLKEVQEDLAIIEARLLLLEGGHPPEIRTPLVDVENAAEAACKVAERGLLSTALRIAECHSLDPWQVALRPFLRLCLEAEGAPASNADALANAAQGPSQALMFLQGDGANPLGAGGSTVAGWWQSLEQALTVVSGHAVHGVTNANGRRLYSLVAEEMLTLRPDEPLPSFVLQVLSRGHSWVTLLRIYMKYNRFKDAVDLLALQVQLSQDSLPDAGAVRETRKYSPLQDFPVQSVAQLQRALKASARGGDGAILQCSKKLDATLKKLTDLWEEAEKEWFPAN